MKSIQRAWNRGPLTRLFLVSAAFATSLSLIYGFNSLSNSFQNFYPTSTIADYTDDVTGDDCLFCHVPSGLGRPGNAYLEGMQSTNNNYNTLDGRDSDGDGVANGIEVETTRSDFPTTLGGRTQIGYNPGLIDCPDGRLGYDPHSGELVTGVHETPPGGTVWQREDPAINCDDNLDNDCDGQWDEDDPDCSAGPSCLTNSDCSDGVFCNGAEVCQGGECRAGTSVNCNDGVACTTDTCNEGADRCDHALNNASCNDGLFCNGDEFCDLTQGCQNDPTPPCPGQACNENTNQCAGCSVDADCNDGLFCNGTETCVAGDCRAGTPVSCGDAIGCTTDSCNEATDSCQSIPNHNICDDNLFCNGAEVCDPNSGCESTVPPCGGGSCNENTNTCDGGGTSATVEFQNGAGYNGTHDTTLDEGQPNTNHGNSADLEWDNDNGAEQRVLLRFADIVGGGFGQIPTGASVVDATLTMTFSDTGTTGDLFLAPRTWNEGTATWSNYPVNLAQLGASVASLPTTPATHQMDITSAVRGWVQNPSNNHGFVIINRSNNSIHARSSEFNQASQRPKLTVEYTTGSTGGCTSDAQCSDGVFCNGAETCQGGICQGGTPPACNDGDICTDDTCNESGQTCSFIFDASNAPQCDDGCTSSTECDDGIFCNGTETCQAGTCQAGSPPSCDDGDVCTDDVCNENLGDCVSTFDPSNAPQCGGDCEDRDGDGHSASICGGDDCNDSNNQVFPGAPEVCDNVDNDCNDQRDEAMCNAFDADGDARVDGIELAWLGRAFGLCSSNPDEWWRQIDLNRDGCVTGDDLALLGAVWNCSPNQSICQ